MGMEGLPYVVRLGGGGLVYSLSRVLVGWVWGGKWRGGVGVRMPRVRGWGGVLSLSIYMFVYIGGKWQICVNAMRRTETPQISRIFFLVHHPHCLVDNRTLGK